MSGAYPCVPISCKNAVGESKDRSSAICPFRWLRKDCARYSRCSGSSSQIAMLYKLSPFQDQAGCKPAVFRVIREVAVIFSGELLKNRKSDAAFQLRDAAFFCLQLCAAGVFRFDGQKALVDGGCQRDRFVLTGVAGIRSVVQQICKRDNEVGI